MFGYMADQRHRIPRSRELITKVFIPCFCFISRSKDVGVDEFFNNDLDSDDEEPESDNEDFAGIDTIVEEDDGSDMELPKPKKQTAAEKQKQAAKEEAAKKIQLDALKEKDPEFYKYLQENDQELLAFDGEMEDLVSEEEMDEDEDEEEEDDDEEMEGSDEEMEEDVSPKVCRQNLYWQLS